MQADQPIKYKKGSYTNLIGDEELKRLNGGKPLSNDKVMAIKLAAKVTDEVPEYSYFKVQGIAVVTEFYYFCEDCDGHPVERSFDQKVAAYTEQEALFWALDLIKGKHWLEGGQPPEVIRLYPVSEDRRYVFGRMPVYNGLYDEYLRD